MLYGSLNIEGKTVTPEHTHTDHTRRHDLSGGGSWCSPLTVAGSIKPSDAVLGQWIETNLQQTVWMKQQMVYCGLLF